jgi:geranylgeranyl reductase
MSPWSSASISMSSCAIARALAGAERRDGAVEGLERDTDGTAIIVFKPTEAPDAPERVRARVVIAADGARSRLAQQEVRGADKVKSVFAYHEIVRAPKAGEHEHYNPDRCDVWYDGASRRTSTAGSSPMAQPPVSARAAR